jgi:outer membrane protein assembly factor BamB
MVFADNRSVTALATPDNGLTYRTRVLDPRTGAVRFEIDGAALPAGPVVVRTNTRATGNPSLDVFDARTGKQLWSRPGAPLRPVVPMGTRLGIVDTTGLTVVDARTGATAWSVSLSLPADMLATLQIAGDQESVVIITGHTIAVLDAGTGTDRFPPIELAGTYEVINSLVVSGAALYVSVGCSANG